MAVLLWTNQIQKFADFVETNPKCLEKLGKIRIFGEDLKVADYNRLCNLSLGEMDISAPLGTDRDTFIFCLGEAFALHTDTIYVLASADKAIVDFAKTQGIEILSLTSLSKPTPKTVRKPRTTKAVVDAQSSFPAREETSKEIVDPKVKRETKKKVTSDTSDNISDLLKKLVNQAENETGNAYAGQIEDINHGIQNASDVKIGLPFQMQLIFGQERGEKLAKVLAPHFDELRNIP